jgi:hypothetical protein
MEVVRIVAAIAGGALVVVALVEAFRTFVVPRGLRPRLSQPVTRSIFRSLGWISRRLDDERRAALMVHAGPLAVMTLPLVWLLACWLGYAAIFWAIEPTFDTPLVTSGSSLLTLGFDKPPSIGGAFTAFSEAAVGLALLAVVIAYLPTLMVGFARRESAVAKLDARAGTPPSALTLIERHAVFAGIEHLDHLWPEWEEWIVDVGQSHSTHPLLTLFRSGTPAHSWVAALGAMLDAANLRLSALQDPGGGNANAWFFYRAAVGVLVRLVGFFRLPLPEPPRLDRAAFDRTLRRFAELGVPVADDHDAAWERVTARWDEYEPLIVALGYLVDARRRPPLLG